MTIRIELVPTLEHCIESAARHEFRKAADEYMQLNKEDKNLEERIELLRMFLDTADFRQLRAESEKHLTEGKVVRFILTSGKGTPGYELKCEIAKPT
jgi:transcription elongation GreA/GreB family factor